MQFLPTNPKAVSREDLLGEGELVLLNGVALGVATKHNARLHSQELLANINTNKKLSRWESG